MYHILAMCCVFDTVGSGEIPFVLLTLFQILYTSQNLEKHQLIVFIILTEMFNKMSSFKQHYRLVDCIDHTNFKYNLLFVLCNSKMCEVSVAGQPVAF